LMESYKEGTDTPSFSCYTGYMTWYVYIFECLDGSLYTGVTTDLERRERQHNEGLGSKYVASRRGGEIVWFASGTRSWAFSEEYRIKKLKRDKKLELIATDKNKPL
jgi:putative endonuclease